jgi:menaquinone-specific isochorismate synthase
LAEETWQAMVTGALQRIRRGELEKVVLARTLQAQFDRPPGITAALTNLAERYPDCYRFMIEPQAGQVFLAASPELLAEVNAPIFRTTALAGTIRRGSTPAEDDRLGQALLNDPKERQEHAIVIRVIQDKLAPLAVAVETAPAPRLRKLGNVQHLETAIQGKLAYGWGVLDVVAALHPTPAMGGYPQAGAQAYLAQAEPFERGWYAAPVGWIDPWGNGLFAVGIRSGLFSGQAATLFAGAGIVADSNPAKEWQETGLKFKPLLEALGGALPHG